MVVDIIDSDVIFFGKLNRIVEHFLVLMFLEKLIVETQFLSNGNNLVLMKSH